jgi:hypothetical protein
MTLPNFLIVGAKKSGTTSLYYYLKQHPDIYMPDVKEPDFFTDGAPRAVRTLREYQELFAGWNGQKALGEASTSYLPSQNAANKVFRLLPEAKIIIVLRNPVDVAYSMWGMMHLDYGLEKLSFSEALQEESRRMRDKGFLSSCGSWPGNFFYLHLGLYYEQVKRYIDIFGPEKVQVHIFEEFKEDPLKSCRQIFDFLGVDHDFVPIVEKHNIAAISKSRVFQRLLAKPHPFLMNIYWRLPHRVRILVYQMLQFVYKLNRKTAPRPPLDKTYRKELKAKYMRDIQRLERLLSKDLSVWYSNAE